MTDEQIILQYQSSRDQTLLSSLYKTHARDLFGLAYYYLSDKAGSKDIVMEVFEVVLKSIGDKEITNFKGWINGICRRMCLKKLTRQVKTVDLDIIPEPVMEIDDFLEYNNKMVEQLRESMANLNHDQRICVEAFYLKEMSYKEISVKYALEVGKVKSYIQNGKRNLKNNLEQYRNIYYSNI